ncbi:MAG: DUF2202 domain-containing protein, partial [Campylobacterales bacterium]|nr:DUF2202 domain-containing protein [Campylobacterales bacterium]
VGCKVEVADINAIETKLESEIAEDVKRVLEQLKRGSYHHYFGFNKALEEEGVSEGCCSLGDDYCLEADHKIMRPKKRH